MLLVKDVSRLKVAQVVGAYKDGKYANFPHLIRHFSTDHVRIICDKPTGINLDGEKWEAEVIDIRVADEKLRNEIKQQYPEMYQRMMERREYIINEIGINLSEDFLPTGSVLGYLRPLMLSKKAVVIKKN